MDLMKNIIFKLMKKQLLPVRPDYVDRPPGRGPWSSDVGTLFKSYRATLPRPTDRATDRSPLHDVPQLYRQFFPGHYDDSDGMQSRVHRRLRGGRDPVRPSVRPSNASVLLRGSPCAGRAQPFFPFPYFVSRLPN